MPELRRDGGRVEILQLWLNLTSTLKGVEPGYVGLEAGDIPHLALDDGRAVIDVVSGQFGEQQGAMQSLTGAAMQVGVSKRHAKNQQRHPQPAQGPVRPAGGSVSLPAPADRAIFLYVAEGSVTVNGDGVDAYTRRVRQQRRRDQYLLGI